MDDGEIRGEEPDSTSSAGSQCTSSIDPVEGGTGAPSTPVGVEKRKCRRTESLWRFFVVDGKDAKCTTCKAILKGQVTSSMRKHLRTKHPNLQSNAEEAQFKKEGEVQGQPRIKKFCIDKNLSSMDRLIDLFSQTTIATSLVEVSQFKNFVESLSSSFKVPSLPTLQNAVKKRFDDSRSALKNRLVEAKGISLTTDLWTNKGLSKSFIAVTAHFADESSAKLVAVLLDIMPIKQRHYSEVVREAVQSVLADYDLLLEQITAVVTDNGANVVKAFDDREEYQLASLNTNGETDDYADDEIFQPGALVDEDEEEDDVMLIPKRLSCVIHSMQLVLKKVVTTVLDANGRVEHILQFVRNFRSSSTCVQELLKRTHLTLVLPSRTRWNYIYQVFRRLKEVWDSLQEVCAYLEREFLTARDFAFVNKVLQPSITSCDAGLKPGAIDRSFIHFILHTGEHIENLGLRS